MARPIKAIPTLTGEAASIFLKRADAAERRYKETDLRQLIFLESK